MGPPGEVEGIDILNGEGCNTLPLEGKPVFIIYIWNIYFIFVWQDLLLLKSMHIFDL